uniref:JmjC domain-containing protein n=1 Tax=Strongyloides papillosus TaxID=174720 RepID=A0A0N5C6L5_STREA
MLHGERDKSITQESKESRELRKSKECELMDGRQSRSSSKPQKLERTKCDVERECRIPKKQPKVEIKNEARERMDMERSKEEPKSDNERQLPRISKKFTKFIKFDIDPNGQGEFLRVNWKDVINVLTLEEQKRFVDQFIRLAYWEVNENAVFVCAIIENGASDIEDMFNWLMKDFPNIPVRCGSLTSKVHTKVTKYKDYYEKVIENYSNGTFRYGGLEALSIVGKKKEEYGGVFEEYLDQLNNHIITGPIMPWGKFTINTGMKPSDSDDGPIFWVRPGEQCFTTDEIDGSSKDKQKPKYCGLRKRPKREIIFQDRTPSHADFTKCGLVKDCTGAVGILKAIRGPSDPHTGINRILKDVVCFPAQHIDEIVQFLNIDLSHPPLNQCNVWVDEGRLNELRRNNIKYVHVSLKENCVYFLPRKVIHQFRTVSACSSIAWHARLRQYYSNNNDGEVPLSVDSSKSNDVFVFERE